MAKDMPGQYSSKSRGWFRAGKAKAPRSDAFGGNKNVKAAAVPRKASRGGSSPVISNVG